LAPTLKLPSERSAALPEARTVFSAALRCYLLVINALLITMVLSLLLIIFGMVTDNRYYYLAGMLAMIASIVIVTVGGAS
jgi:hypothetical protein